MNKIKEDLVGLKFEMKHKNGKFCLYKCFDSEPFLGLLFCKRKNSKSAIQISVNQFKSLLDKGAINYVFE